MTWRAKLGCRGTKACPHGCLGTRASCGAEPADEQDVLSSLRYWRRNLEEQSLLALPPPRRCALRYQRGARSLRRCRRRVPAHFSGRALRRRGHGRCRAPATAPPCCGLAPAGCSDGWAEWGGARSNADGPQGWWRKCDGRRHPLQPWPSRGSGRVTADTATSSAILQRHVGTSP